MRHMQRHEDYRPDCTHAAHAKAWGRHGAAGRQEGDRPNCIHAAHAKGSCHCMCLSNNLRIIHHPQVSW